MNGGWAWDHHPAGGSWHVHAATGGSPQHLGTRKDVLDRACEDKHHLNTTILTHELT